MHPDEPQPGNWASTVAAPLVLQRVGLVWQGSISFDNPPASSLALRDRYHAGLKFDWQMTGGAGVAVTNDLAFWQGSFGLEL